MRILYLSGSYIPSRRASSIQVMRMCAALAGLGHEVTLVSKSCPARSELGVRDDFAFYGVPRRFALVKIPRPSWRGGGLRYLLGIAGRFGRGRRFDLYYCREPLAAWLLSRRGLPVLYEAHGLPAGRWRLGLYRQLLRAPSFRRLVVISAALRERLGRLGLRPETADTVVAHDAAQPIEVGAPPPLTGRPARLGYVGHLYPGRGVEILRGLAERLPDCRVHVVGGSEADLARWRARRLPANLLLHGFVPPARLADIYGSFDILLMPYQERLVVAGGRTDTSQWMSPMKLFEYMATGRPIVAADLPVLREVLTHERNALLVAPGQLDAWVGAVESLLADEELRRWLAERAQREQQELYTWEARARAVLAGLDGDRA